MLTYSNESNQINLEYDSLNRVTSKNGVFNYSYDGQLQGTLTNVTSGGTDTLYEYDDRGRVVKEIKIIDGIRFEREYVYNSADGMIASKVSGKQTDFILNKQNQVTRIPGFIADAQYNPNGALLQRTYNNSLIQSFSYNDANGRLTGIVIPNVQNLTYSYDSVGNILSINDAVNARMHNMTYDNLHRLLTVDINNDHYEYEFNSIGNMMRIRHNNQTKHFVYNGSQAHAPSEIINSTLGANVQEVQELDSTSRNRIFTFNVEGTGSYDLDLSYGDGSTSTHGASGNVMAFVAHNYSSGGSYDFVVNTGSDKQVVETMFGISIDSLNVLSQNASEFFFEMIVHNDVDELARDVSWVCSDGISSIYSSQLLGHQSLYDYVQHNFNSPGDRAFVCTVTSQDGTDTITIELDIPEVEVEDYDVLIQSGSSRVVSFNAFNHYYDTNTNLTIDTNGETITQPLSIGQNESVMIFTEVDYTTDGLHNYQVELQSSQMSEKYTEVFRLFGSQIQNYFRHDDTLRSVYSFDVVNNWDSGSVSWNLTNPDLDETVTLNNSNSVMVFVEEEYNSGSSASVLSAQSDTQVDTVRDVKQFKPVEVSMNTLHDGRDGVAELIVENHVNSTTSGTWTFDTGSANITSSSMQFNGTTFVYVQDGFSAGVHKTQGSVAVGGYSDHTQGVVIS